MTEQQQQQQQRTYMQLNVESLQQEFPSLDASIVKDIYIQSDKDCEQARCCLRQLLLPTSGHEEEIERQSLSNDDIVANQEFCFEELTGDLFHSCDTSDSLCHCVSRDLKMGKGIAVQFKKRFGNLPKLRLQNAPIGGAAILERHHNSGQQQQQSYVYYLVTKERYFHKPTLESVRQSCEWMRDHAIQHEVRTICMPRIACGLDGLQWSHVKRMLGDVFCHSGIAVRVYSLPPGTEKQKSAFGKRPRREVESAETSKQKDPTLSSTKKRPLLKKG